MPIESIVGFRAAKQEAIGESQSSTNRDKYVHIEWVEDNYYLLNIHDIYLGDGNSDIVDCYRNGVQVLNHDDMIAQQDIEHDEPVLYPDNVATPEERGWYWSDDDSE